MRGVKAILLAMCLAFLFAGTVFAFAAETEMAELKVEGISAITYSDNTTGAEMGDSGHTAKIGIRFDQEISPKKYNYVNGRLKALGEGFLSPVGAADVTEIGDVQDKLGDYVNDYIKLNGKTLRQAFNDVVANRVDLPEPYFAVHVDPDMKGISIFIDNREPVNATYLHQTIVSGEGDSTIRTAAEGNILTIRKGFMSKFTNVEIKKDVSFVYDVAAKEWKATTTPVNAVVDNTHTQAGIKNLLAINFDTEFTQQVGNNHLLSFINENILINDEAMNVYAEANQVDIRVNQIAPSSFNIWQFKKGTAEAQNFEQGTRILLKKELQFIDADGVNPIVDKELAESYMFVMAENTWEQSVVPEGLSVLGYGALKEQENLLSFDVNFSIPLADGNSEIAEDFSWVSGGIEINARTIENWNSDSKKITVKLNGSVLTIIADKSIMALDNTDCVEILDTFKTGSGVMVEGAYKKYYNKSLNSWIDEAITENLVGEEVKVETITPFTLQSGNPTFTITFDKPVSYKYLPHYNGDISWHEAGSTAALGVDALDILKMKIQPAHESILDSISLNGETVRQIMAKASADQDHNVVIMVHYNQDLSSMMFSWQGAYESTVIDYTQEVVLTIDSDTFITPNGAHLAEDVKLTYSPEFSIWYKDGEKPEWKETKVEKVEYLLYMQEIDSYAIQVHFKAPAANSDMQNVQNMDFVKDGFKLNGFTLGEIMQGAKDKDGNPIENPINAHLLSPTGVPGTGKIVLHLFVSAKITPETGGVKVVDDSVNGNEFEVLEGTKLPSMYSVSRDYKFKYEGAWAEVVDTSGIEWEEIHLVSISKPVLASEDNVTFTLTFDKNITHKELLHINADVSWLLAVSQQATPPFRYTAAELNILSAYGILSSLQENILFNGQSIKQMMEKETNITQRPVTVMVHYGQNAAMNQIMVAFAGHKTDAEGNVLDGANRITDLDQEFTFTIKAGFRTSMLGEIKKDVTFRYNPTAGMFIEEVVGGAASSNTNVKSVYYNGFKVENGGSLTFVGITKLDKNLFTVVLEDPTSVFEVTGADSLKIGDNPVTIKITSTDGSTADFNFTVHITEADEGNGGCASGLTGGLYGGAAILILVGTALLVSKKVRKERW